MTDEAAARYYVEYHAGVQVTRHSQGAVREDWFVIKQAGVADPIEFIKLAHESNRDPTAALKAPGWELAERLDYVAGPNLFVARVVNTEADAPRFVIHDLGRYFAVRDTRTELDVATSTSRSGARHIAGALADGSMVLDALGRAVKA